MAYLQGDHLQSLQMQSHHGLDIGRGSSTCLCLMLGILCKRGRAGCLFSQGVVGRVGLESGQLILWGVGVDIFFVYFFFNAMQVPHSHMPHHNA